MKMLVYRKVRWQKTVLHDTTKYNQQNPKYENPKYENPKSKYENKQLNSFN